MSLTIKDVENLAELAKIELTEGEKGEILKDIEGILDYVKVIEEVDVPDVDVKYDTHNIWREDKVDGRDGRDGSQASVLEAITSQFPDSKDGFVKVKKIL